MILCSLASGKPKPPKNRRKPTKRVTEERVDLFDTKIAPSEEEEEEEEPIIRKPKVLVGAHMVGPMGMRPMAPMGMRPMGPMGMRPMGPMGGPNLMGDLKNAMKRRSMKVRPENSPDNTKEESEEKVIDTTITTKAETDSPVNKEKESGEKSIETSTTTKAGTDSPKTKQKGLFGGLFGKSKITSLKSTKK